MVVVTPKRSDFYYTTLCKFDRNAAMYPKFSFLAKVAQVKYQARLCASPDKVARAAQVACLKHCSNALVIHVV